MIYFLIGFLFIYVAIATFIVARDLKKKRHVYLHADESVVNAIHKEAKEQREGLVLKACNDFLNDKPAFVLDILIEAKKRGYFDKRNRYCDDYTFYSLVTVNENLIVISCAYNPTGMFFNPCLINPRINVEVYKNGLWADIKKLDKPENINTNKCDEPKLHTPAKYSLEECLSELKFGRTAEDQKMIDMFILQLKFPTTNENVIIKTETFIDRLMKEKSDLVLRHDKLVEFLKSEKCESLPEKQRELLRQQNAVMQDYIDILTDRIILLR